MKIIEYQHRCEGGGNDVTLDCSQGWSHGELVLVVPKRGLRDLLWKAYLDSESISLSNELHMVIQQIDKL